MRTELLCTAVLLVSWMGARASDLPTVNVTPPPAPTLTTYDPANPPSDLNPGEAGDTSSAVGVGGGPYGEVFDGNSTVTITDVGEVTTSLSSTTRLPTNADGTLKQHEQGHSDLIASDYTASAQKKVQDAYRGFVGMKFIGKGATPAARQADALMEADAERDRRNQAAGAGIESQIATLNDKFDNLTSHGTSQAVTSAQGEDMAKKEVSLAPAAGSTSFRPYNGPGVAGTADPPTVSYNPATSLLSFSPGVIDYSGAGAADPLLGASITVDPMVMIGLQPNGSIHLGDSALNVTMDGQTLLHGYLIEAAYMSSSLPGFAAMIQATLDIPPDFTGVGITNSIGSPDLAALQQYISSGEQLPMFWLYTNQPLFDDNAQPLTLSSVGTIKFGVPTPEPPTAVLLIGALPALYVCVRKGRRATPLAS